MYNIQIKQKDWYILMSAIGTLHKYFMHNDTDNYSYPETIARERAINAYNELSVLEEACQMVDGKYVFPE